LLIGSGTAWKEFATTVASALSFPISDLMQANPHVSGQ